MNERALGIWFLIAGIIGTLAASILMIERIELLKDPAYVPSCSLSPLLNCGSIMESSQSAVFGFPNPIMGLIGFPVLAATGAALVGSARLPRWYWLGLQTGLVFGLGFVLWLAFQSLYRIEALCPYCLAVWVVVIPSFWYGTLRNLSAGAFGLKVSSARPAKATIRLHAPLLLAAYVAAAAAIAAAFWGSWSEL